MDSDVEMHEQHQKPPPALVTSVPHPPPDSQQASPIVPDVDDSASMGPDERSAPDVAAKISTEIKGKGKPASAKPKSTKARARSPSPSPPPPPQPPLQTIRLEIKLGGPENYEVDVAALAKATGQRPASPPAAVKPYESGSDGEGAPESGVGTDGEKKGRKVRKTRICVRVFILSRWACVRRRKRTSGRSTTTWPTRSSTTRNSRSTSALSSRRRSNRDFTSSLVRSRCSRRNHIGSPSRRSPHYRRQSPSRDRATTRTRSVTRKYSPRDRRTFPLPFCRKEKRLVESAGREFRRKTRMARRSGES